jgi:tetratricopeptide (TPR) repeat protein
LYVLWLAEGIVEPKDGKSEEAGERPIPFDPLARHPDDPLAEYLAACWKPGDRDEREAIGPIGGNRDGFVQQLAEFHDLWLRRELAEEFDDDPKVRKRHERDVRRTLDFVRRSTSRQRAWFLLTRLFDRVGALETDDPFEAGPLYDHKRRLSLLLAEAAKPFESIPGLEYAARYQHARFLAHAWRHGDARERILELRDDALDSGFLPPISVKFRETFFGADGGREPWEEFVHEISARLVAEGARPAAIRLAGVLHGMHEGQLAEKVFADAIAGAPSEGRWATTLQAVEYLCKTGQETRADAVLEPLLGDKRYADVASLWRLAAAIAERRGMTARSLSCTERAMELEHDNLPETVDLRNVRRDYGKLLERYEAFAKTVSAMQAEPLDELIGQVIRTADRWRSLDPDVTEACRKAARILADLGENDLAWGYFTTSLPSNAEKPIPWAESADTFRREGHYMLADRAYAWASRTDPANAEVVWDRARTLAEAGRADDAERLFRRLAEGEWDAAYESIQSRAKDSLRESQVAW